MTTTYAIMVRHYDSGAMIVKSGITRKQEAVRLMRLETKILEMNGNAVYETPEGEIKILAIKEDRTQSTFWIRAIKH